MKKTLKLIPALLLAIVPCSSAASGTVDWSGWYVTAFGGNVSGELNSNDPSHFETTGNFDDSGMIAGIQAGKRFQRESGWVVGLEATLPLHMDKGTAEDTFYFPGLVTYEADYRYALFLGAEAGKAIGKALFSGFGTAGFANVDGKTYNVNLEEEYEPGFVQNATANHFVWQLGVGVDYQVTPAYFMGGRFALFTAAKSDHTMPWNEPGPNEFGFDATTVQARFGRRF